jgi:hypothetical protein
MTADAAPHLSPFGRDRRASLRSEGPVDAAGLWKAADGFEAQQERTRPPLPTSPCKAGTRPPASHSAHKAAAGSVNHSGPADHLTDRPAGTYRRFAPTAS